MESFSKIPKAEFLGDVIEAIRKKAASKKIGGKDAVIAIGLMPVSEGAEKWLDKRTGDGLSITIVPLRLGEGLSPKMVARTSDITDFMASIKDDVELQREQFTPRSEINYTKTYDNGTAIYFEICEHDYSHCMMGGRLAMDVYVYVGGCKNADVAATVAWASEKPIADWAEENHDMWTQTHRR